VAHRDAGYTGYNGAFCPTIGSLGVRSFPGARFLSAPPSGELPSVIISTEGQAKPNLSAGYRGQDFAWWLYPAWQEVFRLIWRWLVFEILPNSPFT
jgi:hypothetical protein